MSRKIRDLQTEIEWDAIQEHAKEAARQAVVTGDASKLTTLGRAYYKKFKKEFYEQS